MVVLEEVIDEVEAANEDATADDSAMVDRKGRTGDAMRGSRLSLGTTADNVILWHSNWPSENLLKTGSTHALQGIFYRCT